MRIGAARRRFFRLLDENGTELPSVPPAKGFDLLLHAYRQERYRNCEPAEGNDSLLFRSGLRTWGRSEWFELEFTRRLFDEETGKGRLLRLVFRFHPEEIEGPVPEKSDQCSAPREIEKFRRRVKRSGGYRAITGKRHAHVDLLFPTFRR